MSSSSDGREAIIVVDLGFGDAGKGTITDHLVRAKKARTVVRFNGGAQAGHNVVTSDGRQHVFAQFGSGTFVPGARTHLSRHFVLNPLAMLVEDRMLRGKGVDDAFARTTIDGDALVITPFQRAANRLRELARGGSRHGSCGMGIGETVSDSLEGKVEVVRAKDLRDPASLEAKLRAVREHKRGQLGDVIARLQGHPTAGEELRWFGDDADLGAYLEAIAVFVRAARIVDGAHLGALLAEPGAVVFEGAQGVLLDERRGFHPYTTWSNCTFENALGLLAEHGYGAPVTKLGVVRAYATRHGPGPFVPENAALTADLPDAHNVMGDWQREFRVGWFDVPATRYAIACCGGVDALAVTCLDRLDGVDEWKSCTTYQLPAAAEDRDAFFETDCKGDPRCRFAKGIRLGPRGDLAYQERLTAILMRSTPLHTISAADLDPRRRARQHIRFLEHRLEVPVRIASYGPTANEKQVL